MMLNKLMVTIMIMARILIAIEHEIVTAIE